MGMKKYFSSNGRKISLKFVYLDRFHCIVLGLVNCLEGELFLTVPLFFTLKFNSRSQFSDFFRPNFLLIFCRLLFSHVKKRRFTCPYKRYFVKC